MEPTPLDAALAFLRAVLDSPGVVLPSLGDEWPEVEQLCVRHNLTGNAVLDAWIADAAQSHHLHLVTFDKGFKGFRKLLKSSMVTVLKA